MKNGIDKYWRKTAPNAIKQEEKAQLRAQLLSGGIGEAETALALQNALLVAKVVRIDYPNDWPDALTLLIHMIRTSELNPLHLRRGLLMLLQVVKELATARLRKYVDSRPIHFIISRHHTTFHSTTRVLPDQAHGNSVISTLCRTSSCSV